jgi:hypothetical protein
MGFSPEAKAYEDLMDLLTEHGSDIRCTEVPDAFYPEPLPSGGKAEYFDLAGAQKMCSECPAIKTCALYAILANETEGIWGGTTPNDRRKIRNRLGI